MLSNQLKQGIETISKIVSITQQEITFLKEAQSKSLFSNIVHKNNLITTFYTQKVAIDNQISNRAKQNPDIALRDSLSELEITLLSKMEDKLNELKVLNKNYKRLLVGVGEFYLTMLEKLLPNRMTGYDNTTSVQKSFHLSI